MLAITHHAIERFLGRCNGKLKGLHTNQYKRSLAEIVESGRMATVEEAMIVGLYISDSRRFNSVVRHLIPPEQVIVSDKWDTAFLLVIDEDPPVVITSIPLSAAKRYFLGLPVRKMIPTGRDSKCKDNKRLDRRTALANSIAEFEDSE